MDNPDTWLQLALDLVRLHSQRLVDHAVRTVTLKMAREVLQSQGPRVLTHDTMLAAYVCLRLAVQLHAERRVFVLVNDTPARLRKFVIDDKNVWVWLLDGPVETIAVISFHTVLALDTKRLVFPKLFDRDPYGIGSCLPPVSTIRFTL